MSRPLKKGLSYFPLDTDFVRDLKVQRLLLEFGCEGLSVFITVLCEAYASQGYYVEVKGGFYQTIGFPLGLKEEQVKRIIRFCLEFDLFDADLFDTELILTSRGIQRRYGVISRHTKNQIKANFCLIGEEDWGGMKNTSHSINNKNIEVRLKGNENVNENVNVNENENENKIPKRNENLNEKPIGGNYGKKESTKSDNSDEARRDELLRMAEAATTNRGHA